MDGSARRVTLAAVGAAHGVKGEVRVKTFLEEPTALGAYGPLFLPDGRALHLLSVRPIKADLVIARFREIVDRTAAEALNGLELSVPRAALPPAEDAETFYHADLIGLRAETADGTLLGTVTALHDFGAGDVIEIAGPGGARLLPFTKAVVPIVDIPGGRIVVEPPHETEAER